MTRYWFAWVKIGRDDALAAGVVEGVVDRGRRGRRSARLVRTVHVDRDRPSVRLEVARHVDNVGDVLSRARTLGVHSFSSARSWLSSVNRDRVVLDGGVDRDNRTAA